MSGDWGGLAALLATWAAFAVYARAVHRWRKLRERKPHSPVDASFLREWLFALLRADSDSDSASDSGARRKGYRSRRGYRLVAGEEDAHTAVEWEYDEDPEPAEPDPEPEGNENSIDRWVRRSMAAGTRTGKIVAEGQQVWVTSEASMWRAIRRVRAAAEPKP